MDYRKLIRDILTFNVDDLGKRFSKLWRKMLRIAHSVFRNYPSDVRDFPFIINNRNRYSYLLLLVDWLESNGFKNIIIIDNQSTYPPLLIYYNNCKHHIHYSKINGGPYSLWSQKELKKLTRSFYFYSDADVVPDSTCSLEHLQHMLKTLKKNFGLDKIGLGLRIDNLPDHYHLKKEVIHWESRFWQRSFDQHYFKAPVDTTFALYAPYAKGGGECKALRSKPPALALHMPWYEDTNLEDAERSFYIAHAVSGNSHWTDKDKP